MYVYVYVQIYHTQSLREWRTLVEKRLLAKMAVMKTLRNSSHFTTTALATSAADTGENTFLTQDLDAEVISVSAR